MSQFTKKAIIETFLLLLEKQPLDKITVKDIVVTCGINRNTFYYYYQDIYDLINDLFEMETKKVLDNEERLESWEAEIRRSAGFALDNKKAIAHVYQSKSRDILEKYLHSSIQRMTKKYIDEVSKKMEISTETKDFVCNYYSYTVEGLLYEWIQDGMKVPEDDMIKKATKIMESTIKIALIECEKC